jgi:hypothetical protein
MPTYIIPNFNLVVGIYRHGAGPPAVPAVLTVGNLSPGELNNDAEAVASPPTLGTGGMWLRLPKATDVRDSAAASGTDVIECPTGSGRVYDVVWVDDIGAGFANEHRFALLAKKSPWPVPFPTGSGGGPPPPPSGYYGPSTTQTGGVASQALTLNANPCLAGADKTFFAVAAYFSGPLLPTYLVDGAGAVPAVTVNFPGPGVTECKLAMFESPLGAVSHSCKVDVGPGNTAFFELIGINVASSLATSFGANQASGVGTPPISCAFGGAGVPVPTNFCFACSMEAGAAAPVNTFAAPFADFTGGLLEAALGNQFNLNFGGIQNQAAGALTATRNSAASGNDWGVCVLGKR